MELFKSLENKTNSFNDPFKHFELNEPLTNDAIEEISKAEDEIKTLRSGAADKINRIGQLRQGVIKVIENPRFSPDVLRKYTIADMITGYGVAEAVRHYYSIYGGSLKGKKAIVQGFGNVGSAAAFYFADMGAKVIGIIDRDGGLINEDGFTFEEIKTLFLNKDGNKLVSDKIESRFNVKLNIPTKYK